MLSASYVPFITKCSSDVSRCSLLPCAQPLLTLPVTEEAAQLLFMKKFSSFFIVPQPFLEGVVISFFTFSFAKTYLGLELVAAIPLLNLQITYYFPKLRFKDGEYEKVHISTICAILFSGKNNVLFP